MVNKTTFFMGHIICCSAFKECYIIIMGGYIVKFIIRKEAYREETVGFVNSSRW